MMMWVKVKYDNLGRMWPISAHQDKSETKGLKANEGVVQAIDMADAAIKAAEHNAAITSRLSGREPAVITHQDKPQGIDPKKVSQEGIDLIRQFMEDSSDLKVGKLMAIHNQEQWSESQFCCGSQRQTLERLINEFIKEHGVHLGLQ